MFAADETTRNIKKERQQQKKRLKMRLLPAVRLVARYKRDVARSKDGEKAA